ncbi:HIT family protein [Galactobacter caseinivorans]|uniref:HIT family protein n=1 Tax=Galactobacter caseinivorans TaxID=2676123 RepID=A0A496PMR2_9MICC|nr:HIT family protein [Galactobacter caseinivorans]RKW71821.1 HIT family protein [Galactobacter caseinivorans]
MPTLFTHIINGDVPGRFVWKDEHCVAFLSIGPLAAGHTLVVPRQEVDRWTDAPTDLLVHLTEVAQVIGKAQVAAFGSARAGLEIAGFEVPHLHLHVWPTNSMADFDLSKARTDVPAEEFDAALHTLRAALVAQGHGAYVPEA